MKLCISSTGRDLSAAVDPRFGRAAGYIIVDSDSGAFEYLENAAAMAGGGAGSRASQTIIDKGAQAVLTGNVGPNAFAVLNAAGIAIYTGVSGSVRDAVDAFNKGSLQTVAAPTAPAHAGSGGRRGCA